MLTLEIEFLAGICFAAQNTASPQPDWPPQPDRVFSALVAAWGARGEHPGERAALEWLEQQPPPLLEASDFDARRVGISYVPPNDVYGRIQSLPERRGRQPRMFPAAIPHAPLLRMRWASAPNDTHAGALQSLAQDTPYLGHSASVVRCRFLLDAPPAELELKASKRRVYPGRLAELERSYRSATRPLAGESVDRPDRVPAVPAPASVFGSRWIVLDDAGGKSPDLRAIALVARRLREALQNHYGKAGLAIPEWISGHQPDGSPSKEPHLAVVPMADIGYEHSEGRLMGLAVVLPRILEEQRRASELRWAGGLEDDQSVAHWRTFQQKLADVSELILGPLGVWRLSRVIESNRPTLQPHRYVKESRQWATATPIVLDRFIKAKSPEERVAEIAAVIADACVNIGLPKPVSVRCAKHPAVRGTPSAYPSGSAPSWTEWSLPGSLTKRMLTHAMIEFAEPVQGPIILGAGRFVGLGLCMAAGANRE